MLVLIHSSRLQTKSFKLNGETFDEIETGFSKNFAWDIASVTDLNSLSKTLLTLETQNDRMVIRGALNPGIEQGQIINRRMNGVGANIRSTPCQWLCVDIDNLEIPQQYSDYNSYLYQLAIHTSETLPPEFLEVDFHFQFSSSMGIKPGIRVHLWYWLQRAISDAEAKTWLSGTPADLSLYNPVQPHFTAKPIFDPLEADPVPERSRLVKFENGLDSVPVPNDMPDRMERQEQARNRNPRNIGNDGRIDPIEIVRNADGKAIDGRERLLFLKSIDAAREITKGLNLPKDCPQVAAFAKMTWEMFIAEAEIGDGRWTFEDALEKAQYRHREVMEGWKPSGRTETTTLIPGIQPYFEMTPVPAKDGSDQLETLLSGFFQNLTDGGKLRKLALRITMGAGKTTATIEQIKSAFVRNPNLQIEFYLPRHDLIRELLPKFAKSPNHIQITHIRGRGETNGDEPELCGRYGYVRGLEEAGYTVQANACWKSDDEKCVLYDECGYQKQFLNGSIVSGAVRLLPHANLPIPRRDRMPEPDLVIIDESFLATLHQESKMPSERVRSLFNHTDKPILGDQIVNALRDGFPLLALLRENDVSAEWLGAQNRYSIIPDLGFQGDRYRPPRNLEGQSQREGNFFEAIKRILIEEMGNPDRYQVERIRFDPRNNEVVANWLSKPEFPENTHLLFLDATADFSILEHLFGEVERHRIDIEQRAIVTQVFDRTGSNISWNNNDEKADDLALIINEHAKIGTGVLCVSHKQLSDDLRETNKIENVHFQHFGNLRGIDEYKACETIFITGRNQPPQSAIDGLARALWWDDDATLQHDAAALFNAEPETNLPTEERGYLFSDPDKQAGIRVRTFSDPRIEAIHQQIREAETVQAIARLRLVHSKRRKHIFLLGNLPVEMPIDYLVSWNDLMPTEAERILMEHGNIPLTPTGWLKMRPDLVNNLEKAKKANQRWGNQESKLLLASPLILRLNAIVLSFKEVKNGKPKGREQHHFFRIPFIVSDYHEGAFVGKVPFKDWLHFLCKGDPKIAGSGWGEIKVSNTRWADSPDILIPLTEGEEEAEGG